MLTKLLLAGALVVGLLVVGAAVQPADFHVARSATIAAPPAAVFAQVNDLHKWQEWSPWAKIDPNAKVSFEGPEAGTGASFSWDGNMEVGAGTMTITESRPDEMVKFRLDFVKPFEGTSEAEFILKPEGDQTNVTWAMFGKNNFMAKCVGLFMDCDKMIGEQFEKGLANLNSVVQATRN